MFRTEGSHRQGMGDLSGCLALAEECERHGDECLFIISGGAEATSAIRGRGYLLQVTPSLADELVALRAFRPDVVIINRLDSPAEQVRTIKALGPFVVTMDDAGEAAKEADLNINVLYPVHGAVSDPRYIALKRPFQEAHGRARVIRREVRELLLTQGGSDTYGFTPRILRALEAMGSRTHCTVVVGPAFQHEAELAEAIRRSSLDLSVVRNVQNMAELMWNADLAITAGGLTMFELACVGTPSVAVCGEPFEVETAARLERAGAVVSLGFGGNLDYRRIPDALDNLAHDVQRRRRMSECGKQVTDGRGAERIVCLVRERLTETMRSTT